MLNFSDLRKHLTKRNIAVIIFVFSLLIRVINLNEMGQTWDETGNVLVGASLIKDISKLDFRNPDWYNFPDHPPVSRYIYGAAAYFDRVGVSPSGQTLYNYDYTYARIVSAVLGSLTVLLTFLLAARFFSLQTAFLSGLILSMLPFFLGLNQLITIESVLVFFFTATIYSFIETLRKISKKKILITGILLGLALGSKYTNFLLIPMMLLIYLAWIRVESNKKEWRNSLKIVFVFVIGILTLVIIWPPLIFEPATLLKNIYVMREPFQSAPKELFMGRFDSSSPLYYVVYLFITTPLLVLLAFFTGIWAMRTKRFIFLTLCIFFFFPFVQSFYFRRITGIRYIVEIYIPLSIFAAEGIEYFSKKLKNYPPSLVYFIIPAYLLLSVIFLKPYYLNYYNSLVGGPLSVYQNHSFPLGWWGEGQREAVKYLVTVASTGQTVGAYVIPLYLLPPVGGLTFEAYNPKHNYDFLIVNYEALSQSGDDFKNVPSNYLPIYTVEAQGAPIVVLYQKRN